MAIISRKPRNPSLRFQSFLDSSDITHDKPERSLVSGLRRKGGRNAYGRITVRHRGGGAVTKYRAVDFKRMVRDVPGKVTSIEYDPNRNVRVGLIVYTNGAKTYNILPEGIQLGMIIVLGTEAEVKDW